MVGEHQSVFISMNNYVNNIDLVSKTTTTRPRILVQPRNHVGPESSGSSCDGSIRDSKIVPMFETMTGLFIYLQMIYNVCSWIQGYV